MIRCTLTFLLLLGMTLLSCRSTDTLNQELLTACSRVDQQEIAQLLRKGASVQATRRGRETALGLLIQQYKRSHQERRKRIEDTVTELLHRGADANALHHGFTPLQIATGQGSEVIVSRLITHGAVPDRDTPAGYAPLWQAIWDNNHRIGLILLQAGANPDTRGPGGQTPLQYLRSRGYQKTRLMLHLRDHGGH